MKDLWKLLVTVGLALVCAGFLSAGPPAFVVENRAFVVENKTAPPKLGPPKPRAARSTCDCALTGVCGCAAAECSCPACRLGAATPRPARFAGPYPTPVRWVQQCSGGRCTLVPVYP